MTGLGAVAALRRSEVAAVGLAIVVERPIGFLVLGLGAGLVGWKPGGGGGPGAARKSEGALVGEMTLGGSSVRRLVGERVPASEAARRRGRRERSEDGMGAALGADMGVI